MALVSKLRNLFDGAGGLELERNAFCFPLTSPRGARVHVAGINLNLRLRQVENCSTPHLKIAG